MRAGDVVFFHYSSFLSALVRLVTRSPYSHVALVVEDGVIVEADVFKRVSTRRITETDYTVKSPAHVTDEQRMQAVNYALSRRGDGYNWWLDVKIGLRLIFGLHPKHWFSEVKKENCSELVDLAFFNAGIPRKDIGIPVGECSPAELLELYEWGDSVANNS
jgi:uncharacterized protein YycO